MEVSSALKFAGRFVSGDGQRFTLFPHRLGGRLSCAQNQWDVAGHRRARRRGFDADCERIKFCFRFARLLELHSIGNHLHWQKSADRGGSGSTYRDGGCGLDVVLRENAYKLRAILNGADYTRWNPATDPFLPARYDFESRSNKQVCREALISSLGLATEPRGPVFGMVTRVVEEKGFAILMPILDRLLTDDVRLIVLGEGDAGYETGLAVAARKFPTKFVYRRTYDERLAHMIEAGMDISLIPSRFEPSGLSAMYSLKYGTPPVVRVTGGLADTIVDTTEETLAAGTANGFTFHEPTPQALSAALKRAIAYQARPDAWQRLLASGMKEDWSWTRSAKQYVALYEATVARMRQGAIALPAGA